MATIHLMEGPVGAGKSTYAARLGLERNAPHLDLDEWMVTLFRPDRPEAGFVPWYVERKQRCIEQIWQVACALLDAGTDVVLELGLVGRDDRAAFYSRVDATGHELAVYVLDAPQAERRRRVRARNTAAGATFKMVVTDEVFALANGAWQPPDEQECEQRRIQHVATASGRS
ncbi:MAG: AAA family ATPase [Pseudomonadales bacterium]